MTVEREANALWSYALEVYGRPGVAALCLRLQDEWGADVNMLLCACWLASQGERLESAALQRLLACTEAWRRECLLPLRAVRRFLKSCDDAENLYRHSKELELAAEHWQLTHMLNALVPLAGEPVSGEVLLALTRENLQNYVRSLPGGSVAVPEGLVAELAGLVLGY